jgi:hypothetical protein
MVNRSGQMVNRVGASLRRHAFLLHTPPRSRSRLCRLMTRGSRLRGEGTGLRPQELNLGGGCSGCRVEAAHASSCLGQSQRRTSYLGQPQRHGRVQSVGSLCPLHCLKLHEARFVRCCAKWFCSVLCSCMVLLYLASRTTAAHSPARRRPHRRGAPCCRRRGAGP